MVKVCQQFCTTLKSPPIGHQVQAGHHFSPSWRCGSSRSGEDEDAVVKVLAEKGPPKARTSPPFHTRSNTRKLAITISSHNTEIISTVWIVLLSQVDEGRPDVEVCQVLASLRVGAHRHRSVQYIAGLSPTCHHFLTSALAPRDAEATVRMTASRFPLSC
jgi:hypothetical protein